ncbi:MAG: porin [Duodenibacillus sp.]|nr:porin [Duodenibacillus sp.]
MLGAALIAAAPAVLAADVTLYGVVDTAIAYRGWDTKVSGDARLHQKSHDLSQDSGNLMANRWGVKGVEDLGAAKVGFVLENGFSLDTGALGYGGRMFGREAQVYVEGAYGRLAAGRVGPFVSGNGSYNMLVPMAPYGNQIANYTVSL